MRTLFFFCFFIFCLSGEILAQTSPQIRRLPPSLEREIKIRKGGKVRIIGFVDTIKAQSLIAQSIRDSSVEELDSTTVRDTAIIMIDSSVSVTDKEWLDSMLAELPEYRMTPSGVRFQYPAEILVETTRKVVPQDTTLPSKMDPVTKEDLPLYDAMPMPLPLSRTPLPNTSIELGAGSPYLPMIAANSLIISNDRSALEILGKFKTTGSDVTAIKQYWLLGANGNFLFPGESVALKEQTPQLDIDLNIGTTIRRFATQEPGLGLANLNAGFTVGSPSQLKMQAHGFFSFLFDGFDLGVSESNFGFDLNFGKYFGSLLDNAAIYFESVSQIGTNGYTALGSTDPILALKASSHQLFEFKDFLEGKESNVFRWRVGAVLLYGSDQPSILHIYPSITLQTNFSQAFEIGASLEPENKLIGLRELTTTNLFYSPLVPDTSGNLLDPRAVVTEPLHINLFANYFLSPRNELHAVFRFIERDHEPIFIAQSNTFIKDTIDNFFTVEQLNTRRLEAEVGGNIEFFTKDKLSASILFRSATDRQSGDVLSFEPTAKIKAVYQFGNISDKLIPQIELHFLSRPLHSFTFINLEIPYVVSQQFQLKLRAENIFGNTGDFWPGYDEYPRSVWISGKYSF